MNGDEKDERSRGEEEKGLGLLERLRRYRFLIVGQLTFLSGLGLLIAAELAGSRLQEWSHGALRDLGTSLLIAGTVGLIVELYTRREGEKVLRRLMDDVIEERVFHNTKLRSLGLKQMCIDRSQLDFMRSIQGTAPGGEIRLLAMCMNELANNKAQRMLAEKLEQGCCVRLLLLDPDSPHVRQRGMEEELKDGSDLQMFVQNVKLWDTIHQDFVKTLPPALRARIELRHYDSPPSFFLVDNDTTLLLGFYLRGYRGEEVPHLDLEIKKQGAYTPFRDHFDRLWEASVKCVGGYVP